MHVVSDGNRLSRSFGATELGRAMHDVTAGSDRSGRTNTRSSEGNHDHPCYQWQESKTVISNQHYLLFPSLCLLVQRQQQQQNCTNVCSRTFRYNSNTFHHLISDLPFIELLLVLHPNNTILTVPSPSPQDRSPVMIKPPRQGQRLQTCNLMDNSFVPDPGAECCWHVSCTTGKQSPRT